MAPDVNHDLEESLFCFYKKWNYQPLMSQIPWVTTNNPTLSSKECRLYYTMNKITKDAEPDEKTMDEFYILYKLLGSIFPTFLPRRYHLMNSKVLRRMSTDNAAYWHNTAFFLLQSQQYGQSWHNLISKHLENQTPDILRHFLRLTPSFVFDLACAKRATATDQCESAGEFLLERWVLLQLPFQPSLLHQWAVALLAETLRFQKETVTIFTIGVPEELLEEVQLLKKMHKKLMDGAITLLSIFCNFSRQDPENICKRLRRVREKLLHIITEVTPIVEFILSDKCQKVICGIKQASWTSKQKILHTTETGVDLGSYHVWYNPFFWNEGPLPSSLFSKQMYSLDQQKQFLQKLRLNMLTLKPKTSMALVKKFVRDRIIDRGVLVGASDAEILAVAAKAPGQLQFPCFDYLADLQDICCTTALHERYGGATYNIISLYADLKIEEDTAQSARTLIQLLGSEQFGSKKVLYKEVHVQQGCKFISASADLKYTLDKVLANREWTYEKVLERTRNTFTAPIVERQAPPLKFSAEKVAGIFQARIKNLVLNMLKRQFETSSGPQPMLWYPECSTVQYLLPCFVATFLEMHKDPLATRAQLKNCLLLVHELLLSYEQKPYEQSFTEQWKQPYLYERRKTLYRDVASEMGVFCWCLDHKFGGTGVIDQVIAALMNLLKSDPLEMIIETDDEGLYDWTVQMFMLSTRLKTCVQTLGWYKEPLTISLDKVWDGCYFTGDEELDTLYCMCRAKVQEEEMIKTRFFSQQLMADFAKLNIFHVAGVLELVIYSKLDKLRDLKLETMRIDLQGPSFPLDLQSNVFWAVRSKDTWKLKQLLRPFTNIIWFHKDARHEPLTVDMSKLIIRLMQKSIVDTRSGDGKLWFKMTQPGECTMLPYRHCRWCGLITAEEFRLCSMCKDYPEYLDENFFCSEQCENEALDKQHREEHARFFMLQLNMD